MKHALASFLLASLSSTASRTGATINTTVPANANVTTVSPATTAPSAAGGGQMDLVIFTSVSAAVTAVFATYLLKTHASREVNKSCLFLVWLSWFFTFSYVYLLPVDLNMDANKAMLGAWRAMYWTNFVVMWFVFPFLYCYYAAGEFTVLEKCKSSLRVNLRFYLVCLVVVAIFVIISLSVMDSGTWGSLTGFLKCLSNFYGLAVAIMLLGYGLVAMPRSCWRHANRQYTKAFYETRVAQLHERLDQVYLETLQLMSVFDALDAALHKDRSASTNEILSNFETIRDIIPSRDACGGKTLSDWSKYEVENEDHKVYKKLQAHTSLKGSEITNNVLAELHFHLKAKVNTLENLTTHLQTTIYHALRINVIVDQDGQKPPSFTGSGVSCIRSLKWRFNVLWHPKIYKFWAVLFGLFSMLTLWCEITIPIPMQLSPFGVLITATQESGVLTQLVCLIPWGYMCMCSFYSMYRLSIGNYYEMLPNKATSEGTLIRNAYYTGRFIAPLASNFLAASKLTGTGFQVVMGDLSVVETFGETIELYLPLLVLVFVIATAFNFFGRCLRILRISGDQDDNEIIAEADRKEGLRIINKAGRERNDDYDNAHTMKVALRGRYSFVDSDDIEL